MNRIVPSYIAKLDRVAERHLVDLKACIGEWAGPIGGQHPYEVRSSIEGKKKRKVFRLHFTSSVANTEAPQIFGDAIHNLRSCLDHLFSATATSKPDSVSCLILWRGVWKAPLQGDDKKRLQDRERWTSNAGHLPDPVVAFLKRLQPPDEAGPSREPHLFQFLNKFSNDDKHRKPPIYAEGLRPAFFINHLSDGSTQPGFGVAKDAVSVFQDGAEVLVPPGTVKVDVGGTPQVSIRTQLRFPDGRPRDIPIVDFIESAISGIRDNVFPAVIPSVRK